MKESIKNLKSLILPLLLSITCTYWLIVIFYNNSVYSLIASTVLNTIYFMWLFYIENRKKFRVLYFIIGSAICFVAALVFITAYIWANNSETYVLFGYIIPIAYFFSCMYYYFIKVIIRVQMVFLIGFIPVLFQSVWSSMDMTVMFMIYIISLFLIFMERTRKKEGKEVTEKYINNKWYFAAAGMFLSALLLITIIIPKPNKVYEPKFLDAFITQTLQPMRTSIQDAISQNTSQSFFATTSIKDTSFINNTRAPISDRVLFRVKSEEPLYFRIQSFDNYENNKWIKDNKSFLESKLVNEYKNTSNTKAISVISAKCSKSKYLMNLSNYPLISQKTKNAVVTAEDNSMQSFLNPPGIINIKDSNGDKIYNNEFNMYYIKNRMDLDSNEKYDVKYISQYVSTGSREEAVLKIMNKDIFNDIYYNMFYDISLKKDINEDDRVVIDNARTEMRAAYRNYVELPDNLPGRIKELAKKITKGKTSDYDKAIAIQDYFTKEGFKYDKKPPAISNSKDYNDYFLFESKRGLCVQFASSMVLLARASGLPAKYDEGFAPSQVKEKGRYVISEKDAHAFPEVYIAGYGWMVFEPTVADEVDTNNGFDTFFTQKFAFAKTFFSKAQMLLKGRNILFKLIYLPIGIAICAVCVFILRLILIKIKNFLWNRKICKIDENTAISQIFRRTERVLEKVSLKRKAYETPENFAACVKEIYGLDIKSITDTYSKFAYGDIKPTVDEIRQAHAKYNEIRKYARDNMKFLRKYAV